MGEAQRLRLLVPCQRYHHIDSSAVSKHKVSMRNKEKLDCTIKGNWDLVISALSFNTFNLRFDILGKITKLNYATRECKRVISM